MVNRKPEDKCDTDEKRSHASSDDLFTSAPSQHYEPSVRAVPDSFAPPASTGTNIDDDNWLAHFALRRPHKNRRVAGPLRANVGEQSSCSSTVAAILAKFTDTEADLATVQREECDF